MIIKSIDSPLGRLVLGSDGENLCMCDWEEGKNHDVILRRLCLRMDSDYSVGSDDVIERGARELSEYFSGNLREFGVGIALYGSDFQCRVWRALQSIGYGEIVSYSDVARMIGQPSAVRAVAMACAMNPIAVFVPCHRIVGAGGRLTGYRGGIKMKEFLLDMERNG